MGWGKYLGLLGGIGGGLLTGAIGKHGIDPKNLGFLGGLGGAAMSGAFGHHGGGGESAGMMPQPSMPMPGAMGDVQSPMQPMQMGQPTAPTNFGQPAGMFGAGAPDPRQEMLKKYQQWQMINGGGY